MIDNKNVRAMQVVLLASAMLLVFGGLTWANGELSINNLVISPQPVTSGENITLTLQLYNSYSLLQNVNIGLTGSYPILNYSPYQTQLINAVGPGLYGGVGNYLQYHIHIPKNVQSGTYTLYLVANYEITTTVDGQSTTSAATSSMPITFYVSGTPNIDMSANPVSPLIPGNVFTVDLVALNSGTGAALNTSITLLNSKNFSTTGAVTFNLGTIQPNAAASATASLQANATLIQGTSNIPVRLTYQLQSGQNVTVNSTAPVSVLVTQPDLVASIVSTQPQSLYSGSNQTIVASIQNLGTGIARNVTIKFLSTTGITVGSSSASGIFVGTILPGSSVSDTVFVTADKGDSLTSYHVPVLLTYSNANYKNPVNKTSYLNLTLQQTAEFNITQVGHAIAVGGTYVPLVFTIKNTGTEPAQQVTFTLQTIYPISPVNPNVYVNDLAPGQSQNVTFYVNVDSNANTGSYPVTLYEQWTQQNSATNSQYSSSEGYYAEVASSGGSGNYDIYIAIIIVIVAAIVIYRVMKSRTAATKDKKASK